MKHTHQREPKAGMDDFVEQVSRQVAARLADDLRRLARLVQRGALEEKLKTKKKKRVAGTARATPFRLVRVAR